MAVKKKGGGSNLTRSQVVTVRLDPKLKFAAELAARKQRRTISSFIEWAVEEAVSMIEVSDQISINKVMNEVWDVEEADRFLNLANKYRELLTFDEERLLKVIQEYENTYKYKNKDIGPDPDSIMDGLRRNWETLNGIITGKAERKDLEYAPF